ncbi:ABC transporter permease [Nocardioides coralli]|uniref:ABC transporter permease n=1 Tax=Nocardioides coralli TaxID=2872154 RepID=UPI001CA40512|nr:ABC transporter permease subunit [Nocardioides coralli]QZY30131.1 ABC transporter permease subunit [Nocardioides coralli]
MSVGTAAAHDRGDRFRGILAVGPAVLVVVLVVGTGLVTVVLQSAGLMPLVGQPRLSGAAYAGAADELLDATVLSLVIAGASTLVAAGVGLGAAILLVASPRGRRLLAAIGSAPIPVPHLVGAASVGLLLMDGGLLARWLGIAPDAWPALVAGHWPTAVVVEYAWKESAFVALVVTAALATRIAGYHDTAAVLGADRWARFRHVTLPLATPALVAASAITFVYTLGSYEVAWLLGPVYPEPLPVMAYRVFTSTDLSARPEAMAVAAVTTTLSLASVLVALAWLRRTAVWR